MAMKTQGTNLYCIDPADDSVIHVGCVTSIDGLDSAIEEIETTCLEDTAKQFEPVLANPGQGTFGINMDTGNPTHVRLHELKKAQTVLKWALGWSDGTVAPVPDSAGNFNLPAARSWLSWTGFMNSFPFSFAANSVVQSTIGVRISGDIDLTAKTS